jgi:hypothetical protein
VGTAFYNTLLKGIQTDAETGKKLQLNELKEKVDTGN